MTRDEWRAVRPVILAGMALLGIVFLALLALQIRQLLAVLFLGVILGVTLNPFTEAMSRLRVPRVVAILIVYGLTAALLAGVIAYTAFEIAHQDFDREVQEIREDYSELREGTPLPTSAEMEAALESAARDATEGLAGRVFTALSALAGIATILFTAALFSITQDRLRGVVLSFVEPARRDRATDLLGKYATGLRGFARGEIIAMTTIGVVTFAGLTLLDVRLAAGLAFLAFLMEAIPMIGFWIAAVPAIVVALTQGTWVAIQVAILYAGIQLFENYVVTPMVHSRESEVPALLIFVAITIGGALMGVVGALVALPVAVLLRITYLEVVRPWNEARFRGREVQPRVIYRLEDRRNGGAPATATPAPAQGPAPAGTGEV